VVGNTPAQFRARVDEGTKYYGELVKSGAIKLN
jgi:hypothetical protein